jgi:hypothetical protein
MRVRKFPNMLTRLVMAFGLAALVAGTAQAADVVNSTIPFGFTAGKADLPAGQYRMEIDREKMIVTVLANTGKRVVVRIVTTLAKNAQAKSGDARVVFDKGGDGSHTLSEVWPANADGVLVGMAKEKHEHEVVGEAK